MKKKSTNTIQVRNNAFSDAALHPPENTRINLPQKPRRLNFPFTNSVPTLKFAPNSTVDIFEKITKGIDRKETESYESQIKQVIHSNRHCLNRDLIKSEADKFRDSENI